MLIRFPIQGHAPLQIHFPYSVFIEIVPDHYSENGHPTEQEYDFLNEIEKSIISYLEEQTATVHVGHVTVYRARQIILYTHDKEAVENFLDHFLQATERENGLEADMIDSFFTVSFFPG